VRPRQKLLGWLAAAVVAVPVTIAATSSMSAQAVGPHKLPLTVTNNSGRGDQIYLYVLGVNLNTGRLGYVNEGGAFAAWSGGTVPPSPAPDVPIPAAGNGGSNWLLWLPI
jgi:hypothetical protein